MKKKLKRMLTQMMPVSRNKYNKLVENIDTVFSALDKQDKIHMELERGLMDQLAKIYKAIQDGPQQKPKGEFKDDHQMFS